MLTFFELLPWLGPEFMKTENMGQQNKNKDLFEIGLFKGTSTVHKKTREANVDKFGHYSVAERGWEKRAFGNQTGAIKTWPGRALGKTWWIALRKGRGFSPPVRSPAAQWRIHFNTWLRGSALLCCPAGMLVLQQWKNDNSLVSFARINVISNMLFYVFFYLSLNIYNRANNHAPIIVFFLTKVILYPIMLLFLVY